MRHPRTRPSAAVNSMSSDSTALRTRAPPPETSGRRHRPPLGASPGVSTHPAKEFGVAALVCGITGAVLGLIPLIFPVALVLGVIALVLGLVGRSRAKRGQPVRLPL